MVRNKALAAGARWWLDGLPELIAGLERDWSIRVGRPFEDATEAFVSEAATDDGTPAIWEWGVVERVSTGLWGTKVGLRPVASQMLRAADRVAGAA